MFPKAAGLPVFNLTTVSVGISLVFPQEKHSECSAGSVKLQDAVWLVSRLSVGHWSKLKKKFEILLQNVFPLCPEFYSAKMGLNQNCRFDPSWISNTCPPSRIYHVIGQAS